MPRTRRQQNLVETSLEDPLNLVSGDEGDVAPPREPKISREAKTRLRGMQMSWVKRMYGSPDTSKRPVSPKGDFDLPWVGARAGHL